MDDLRSLGLLTSRVGWREILRGPHSIRARDILKAARNCPNVPVAVVSTRAVRKGKNLSDTLTVIGSVQPSVVEDVPILLLFPAHSKSLLRCSRCGKMLRGGPREGSGIYLCKFCRIVDDLREKQKRIYYMMDSQGNAVGWWSLGREAPSAFLKRCRTSGLLIPQEVKAVLDPRRVRWSPVVQKPVGKSGRTSTVFKLTTLTTRTRRRFFITYIVWEKA